MKYRGAYFLLLSLAFLVGATSFYLSENYLDYDSITRSLMGYHWLESPFLITSSNPVSSVFGPLHCYLGAIPAALGIHPDIGVRLLSFLFSLMVIIFAERLGRLLFGEVAGLYAMMFIVLYSLWIRSAAVASSEAIAGGLFIAGLYYLSLWLRDGGYRAAIFAGLLFALVTATRYEFWMLLPLIILSAFYLRRKSVVKYPGSAILLGGLSGVFVVFWLIGNYLDSGDPLMFVHGAGIIRLNEAMIAQGIAARGFVGNMFYNTLFLPGVTFLSLGVLPIGGLVFLRRRHFARPEARLLLLATVFYLAYHFITFVYPAKTINLARYTYVFGILIAILGAGGLYALQKRLSARVFKIILAGGIVLMLGQNVFYSRFATPSDDPMTERMRALSPIGKAPQDVAEAVAFARSWLRDDGLLTLDYRHSPQRLVFLKLYDRRGQITTVWPKDITAPDTGSALIQRIYLLNRKSPYTRDAVSWNEQNQADIVGANFETVFSSGDYVFVRRLSEPTKSPDRTGKQ